MLFDRCRASDAHVSARLATASLISTLSWLPTAHAQRLAPYLADRGTGIATSMFGEYVGDGELLELVLDLRLAAHAGGIDQPDLLPLPRPVDRAAQSLLTLRQIACATGQQLKPVSKARQHGMR